ncbi:MAG: peptidylprolyl isomerase [Verrucomicrobiota bacterium]|nr:peptidylprolyl isomerase [Verrucomicrobiota bacterium]
MKLYIKLITILALLVTAGCHSKAPLVLLKPKNDIALARPSGTTPGARNTTPSLENGPIVVVETNLGNITIALDKEKAPISVENFLQYVRDGQYDGTLFHRVVQGFVIQGGGYNIAMEEKPTRPAIKNESNNGLRNRRGTVAMARRDLPDSATCQFFINLEDNGFLNADGPYGGYAVFGRVIEGMAIADKIAANPVENRKDFENIPKTPVIIRKVTVKE